MARQRDYRAEERRRNERAKALGFSSRAELRRARERGTIPKAAEIKADPKAAKRFRDLTNAKRAGFGSYKEYREARANAKNWSDKHSQQRASKYRPSMTPEQFRDYNRAIIQPWGRRRTVDDMSALRGWLSHYPEIDVHDERYTVS